MTHVAKAVTDHLNDSVLDHMRTDLAILEEKQTVGEALQSLRAKPPEGRIIYFYVVDDQGRLRGVVPTRRLLLNTLDTFVADIMVREVVRVPAEATVLDACEFFIFHKLLAFPVVDRDSKLLGVVDVELYTDELKDLERREESDELFQLVGVHLSDSKQTSAVGAFQRRFPWLLANIAGGILAAILTGFFEAELKKAVALALFIPVVLALAESVSIQSVSLALQVMRGERTTLQSIITKLRTEALVGLMLGAASAVAVGTVAALWLGQLRVVLSVLGGICGGVTCAAVIGVTTPNLLRLFKLEPQVAAGPVALAMTDMVTLLVYFMLARALFA